MGSLRHLWAAEIVWCSGDFEVRYDVVDSPFLLALVRCYSSLAALIYSCPVGSPACTLFGRGRLIVALASPGSRIAVDCCNYGHFAGLGC